MDSQDISEPQTRTIMTTPISEDDDLNRFINDGTTQ